MFDAVRRELTELDAPVLVLDQASTLSTEIELHVDEEVSGWIRADGRTVDLGAITAAFLRPYDWMYQPEVQRAGPSSPPWSHAMRLHDAIWTWADLASGTVVNRPSSSGSNSSKPYQCELIRSCGFRIAETLVTTQPEAVLEFWKRHGEVVYKSISGIRSIVSRLGQHDLGRLNRVTLCPTQFQEYVPGLDYRAHVVGSDMLFCATVESDSDDYRYAGRAGRRAVVRPSSLPAECEEGCYKLVSALGLTVAGIDLRLSPKGDWYCFEVNPSPAFTYYEIESNSPIAHAVARLLAGQSPRLSGFTVRSTAHEAKRADGQEGESEFAVRRRTARPGDTPWGADTEFG